MLGDTETAALVSRAGSIDWLCLPRFDSPACFAALLGTPEHGRWLLGPAGPARSTRQLRRELLRPRDRPRDRHRARSGSPTSCRIADGRADIVRSVEGLRGTVRMAHEWVVRFDYGKVRPWVSHGIGPPPRRRRHHRGRRPRHARAARAPAPPGPRRPPRRRVRRRGRAGADLLDDVVPVLRPGARRRSTSTRGSPRPSRCPTRGPTAAPTSGPLPDLVCRSLLTLRLMTHSRYGGIVAAPTTSLPEDFGGERNWDYRFCWLRDASLTLEALLASGYLEEARLWRNWLIRAVAGDPEDLQIMYAINGSRRLPERVLDHLPGYAGSAPVRIGNGAVDQRQADVLGEVMIALDEARERGLEVSHAGVGDAAGARRGARRPLGRARQRPLGDPRSPAALHPLPRHGLGGLRPRGPRRWSTGTSTGRSSAGASCATGCATRSSPRATTPRATPSPSTTTRPRWTRPSCSSRSWASCRPTTRGSGARSRRSRTTSCATASCCATAPRPASTACPVTSTPSSPARGGWSARMPRAAWSSRPTS